MRNATMQRRVYRPEGGVQAAHNKFYPRSPRHADAIAHTDHSLHLLHAHFATNKNPNWRFRALQRVDELLRRRELQITVLNVYSPEKAAEAKNERRELVRMFKPYRNSECHCA